MTTPEGTVINIYTTGVTAAQMYKYLKDNGLDYARVGSEMRVDVVPTGFTTASVGCGSSGSTYVANPPALQFNINDILSHPNYSVAYEYSHAWFTYFACTAWKGSWDEYLKARNLLGDPRLNTDLCWTVNDGLSGSDYVKLFALPDPGVIVAKFPPDIPLASDVPGLKTFLTTTWKTGYSGTDTVAPTVSIRQPSNNGNVSGTSVQISASAADNNGVAYVEFYIDGALKRLDAYGFNFDYTWDSTKVADGAHAITTKAYDAAGNTASASINVNVNGSGGDTQAPTVTITSPANGASVSGNVNVNANATDNVGVTKVEFSVDGLLRATDTTSPYGFTWDSTTVTNGTRNLSAKAFDAAGNVASDTISVTVANGDTQPPSTPSGLTASAASATSVNLSWTASTDNVGVTGYWIVRNGVTIASSLTNSYTDNSVSPATTYNYQVIAFDAAGNTSSTSNTATVTTPAAPDTTPPSAPTNLVATPGSSSQINLSWTASTDNVGVTGYDIYRNSTKIAKVTTTSFGDTGLAASTTYSYFVKAMDAVGNTSSPSNTATATTLNPSIKGNITGTVFSSAGGVVAGAKLTIFVSGSKRTYYTSSFGIYFIDSIPVGTYDLRVSAQRFAQQQVQVSVIANTTTTKDITLQKR